MSLISLSYNLASPQEVFNLQHLFVSLRCHRLFAVKGNTCANEEIL